MSQQSNGQQASTSHFDAAKAIVDVLHKLDKTSQTLAMRFAAETLGLQAMLQLQRPPSPASQSLPASTPPGGGGATHSTDIKQFTAVKAPKSDQQFAAVVAYFYRFEAPESEQKESIDGETLTEAARLAGRRRPRKAIFTLNNAKNSGYLDAVGSGKFRINSVGENLVAMALPGTDSGVSTEKRKPRKKKPHKRNPTKKKPTKKKPAKASRRKTAKKKTRRQP